MQNEKSLYYYLRLFWQFKNNYMLMTIALGLMFIVGYMIYPKTYSITTEYYAENKANTMSTAHEEIQMVRLAGGYVFLGNSKNVQKEALQKSGLTKNDIYNIKMEQAQKAAFFKMTISANTLENAKKFSTVLFDVLYARGLAVQRTHEMHVVTSVEDADVKRFPKIIYLMIVWLASSFALSSCHILYTDAMPTKRRRKNVYAK